MLRYNKKKIPGITNKEIHFFSIVLRLKESY